MAKDGRKLELYEVLAAKRAKGKMPAAFDSKPLRQANEPAVQSDTVAEFEKNANIIIDDSVANEALSARMAREAMPRAQTRESQLRTRVEPPDPEVEEEPLPRAPKRQHTTREVVFALDTAFIFFIVVLALVGSSYFLGYKRGQEERPTSLAGLTDMETADPAHLNLRHLSPAPRAAIRPSESDFTLILRTETVTDELTERLELELAEAVARGRQATNLDVQGFIFRTGGNEPRYVLAVGLGRTANDAGLNSLLQVYNRMEGVTLSREPRPYIGCRIAPVRELGTLVY